MADPLTSRALLSRRLLVAVGVCLSFVVVSSSGTALRPEAPAERTSASASTVPVPALSLSPAAGDTRADLLDTLGSLEASIAEMRQDPLLSASLDTAAMDPEASVAAAKQLVLELTSEELEATGWVSGSITNMELLPSAINDATEAAPAGFAQVPNGFAATGTAAPASWNGLSLSGPGTSATVPGVVPVVATANVIGTYINTCNSDSNKAIEISTATALAAFVANQAQSAAYAVLISNPSALAVFIGISVPVPSTVVLAVVYGVLLAVYYGLAQAADIYEDCAGQGFSTLHSSTYPTAGAPELDTDEPEAGTKVRGSSQYSVDQALVSVGLVNDILEKINTSVTKVTNEIIVLAGDIGELNTTLSCTSGEALPDGPPATIPGATPVANPVVAIDSACEGVEDDDPAPFSDASARVDDVLGNVNNLGVEVDVLRDTQAESLDIVDDLLEKLGVFQLLQLRMEIEANLGQRGSFTIGLFQLPAVPYGGYLEYVGEIVRETVPAGSRKLAEADAAYETKQYKDAYKLYQQAYQEVAK